MAGGLDAMEVFLKPALRSIATVHVRNLTATRKCPESCVPGSSERVIRATPPGAPHVPAKAP